MTTERCKHKLILEDCATCSPRQPSLPPASRSSRSTAPRLSAAQTLAAGIQELLKSDQDPGQRATPEEIDARFLGTGLDLRRLADIVNGFVMSTIEEDASPSQIRKGFRVVRWSRYPFPQSGNTGGPSPPTTTETEDVGDARREGFVSQTTPGVPTGSDASSEFKETDSVAGLLGRFPTKFKSRLERVIHIMKRFETRDREIHPWAYAAANAACDSWDVLLAELGLPPTAPPEAMMERIGRLLRGTLTTDQYRRWLTKKLPAVEVRTKELEWEVLPPGFWRDPVVRGRLLLGSGDAAGQREERIVFLDSLGPIAWHRGRHMESRNYLVAEFRHLVFAECALEGNALYYVRADTLSWKEVFRLSKREALKAGAKRILHRADQHWKLAVIRLIEGAREGATDWLG